VEKTSQCSINCQEEKFRGDIWKLSLKKEDWGYEDRSLWGTKNELRYWAGFRSGGIEDIFQSGQNQEKSSALLIRVSKKTIIATSHEGGRGGLKKVTLMGKCVKEGAPEVAT